MACDGDQDNDAEVREPRHTRFTSETRNQLEVRMTGCRLVWQPEYHEDDDDEEEDVTLYLVTSEDKSGRYYHLATVRHNYIDLLPDMMTKAERFIILVITSEGVITRLTTEVTDDERDCDYHNDGLDQTVFNVSLETSERTDLTLPISILSSVSVLRVLALTALLRVIIINCGQGDQEETEDTVKEGIDNDLKIYSTDDECHVCQDDDDCWTSEYYVSNSVDI